MLTFAIALAIMASINLQITLVIFLPLVFAFVASRFVWTRIHAHVHAAGQADDAVSGFMGELFGAVQAIKVANSERKIVSA